MQMFVWDQSAGPSVRLSNPRSDQPTFTPDLTVEYTFELMVFDGDNVGMADEVVITVVQDMSSLLGQTMGNPSAALSEE